VWRSSLTVKSAPFSERVALNPSNVGCLSARLMMNSAAKHQPALRYSRWQQNNPDVSGGKSDVTLPRSFSLNPRWFSSSVHTFDTRDKYSRRCISSESAISLVCCFLTRKWFLLLLLPLELWTRVLPRCCPLAVSRHMTVIQVRTVSGVELVHPAKYCAIQGFCTSPYNATINFHSTFI